MENEFYRNEWKRNVRLVMQSSQDVVNRVVTGNGT